MGKTDFFAVKDSKTKRLVTAALMLALGMILPYATAHGFGIQGTILLPMHIPVLLCGFFAGPLYGALCGLILPVLNSVCTGMPVLYPMGIIMTGELFAYGLVSGLLHKKSNYKVEYKHLYPTLVIAMICGRIVYGIVASALVFFSAKAMKLSVVTAVVQGLPGIVLQLVLIPTVVKYLSKFSANRYSEYDKAVFLIKSGEKTCVTVKDNKITSAESPLGISHIIKLYDEGMLKDSFVADTIIGKAAAMIFSYSGVKGCYGHVMSREAFEWLTQHNITAHYGTLTEMIQNRKGDGMCPMEQTVKEITDEVEAIEKLKAKVKELSK